MTAAIITGLRVKKETVGEITGAARVMRELSAKVDAPPHAHFVDIVGTGGDGSSQLQHLHHGDVRRGGGRRAHRQARRSQRVVEVRQRRRAGGAGRGDRAGAGAGRCVHRAETGIGFMFAPNHHPAMKVVAPVRREMGVRTLFNILGPLTNPAGAPNILMGVFHPDLVGIQVRVLQRLGARHALVVWGRDGLDEISLGAATLVGELRDGVVREYEVEPEDFGLAMASSRNLRVENAEESKTMLLDVLQGRHGVAHDIVCLNAGAALYTADVAASIGEGIDLARATIASGAAHAKMHAFVAASRRLANPQ